uniref:Putative secreted protein n=1 Tax=Anopheles marajoara TaxID=58244 RepID=A0A2M4CAL6_9DIPT
MLVLMLMLVLLLLLALRAQNAPGVVPLSRNHQILKRKPDTHLECRRCRYTHRTGGRGRRCAEATGRRGRIDDNALAVGCRTAGQW